MRNITLQLINKKQKLIVNEETPLGEFLFVYSEKNESDKLLLKLFEYMVKLYIKKGFCLMKNKDEDSKIFFLILQN